MKYSLSKDKIKVLLLENVHENAVQLFKDNGYTNLHYEKRALSGEELAQQIADVHLVCIRSRSQLTAEILAHAQKLIAIGCFSIGTNQVDLHASKMRGIPVFNAPFSNTRSVAELVVGEIIMLMRRVTEKSAAAHIGKWMKDAHKSYEIRGKKLGIVGYGHIGTQVSILAEAMGLNVYYYDIVNKLSMGNAQHCNSLNELLEMVDVLTLHVPETNLTRNMISMPELSRMKTGAYLINASRGTVVDIEALATVLNDGHLAGAAVDVLPNEPKSSEEKLLCQLQGLPNVIITPHIGGSTVEAQANIAIEVSDKLVKYSDVGTTIGAVNFVEIALSPNEKSQRFLHIHKNIPGIMTQINRIFTTRNINIAAQYLQTDAHVGYVITDINNPKEINGIEQELKNIDGTIKARMLY